MICPTCRQPANNYTRGGLCVDCLWKENQQLKEEVRALLAKQAELPLTFTVCTKPESTNQQKLDV